MIFAVPLIGKVLAEAAASELGAASSAQTTDAKAAGSSGAADFTQTVASLDRTATTATQHGVHVPKG